MKICQINTTYGFGSTGVIAKDINDLAKTSGFETISCAQKSIDKNTYIIGNKIDWKIHALFTRIIGMQGYFSRIPTYRLIKYLKKESPDIVQLHNLHSNFINIKMLFNYLSKNDIRTILTLHDCWFFTGKCFHFVESNCDKWKTGCNKCPQKHHSVNSWFFDRSNKIFNDRKKLYKSVKSLTVVGCSEWITSLAKKSPLFEKANMLTIRNGVDINIFNSNNNTNNFKEKYNLYNCFVILCFANKLFDERNKNIKEKLIKNLNSDERLVIIGCGKKRINELKIYNNVICFGHISNPYLMSIIYGASDVFLNLTFADTLPTVNMESICCGTPVITYDSCGSPELIQEDKTGYAIKQLDYTSLIKYINKIKTKKIINKNCSTIGIDSFEKKNQYNKYVSLFKEVCNKK